MGLHLIWLKERWRWIGAALVALLAALVLFMVLDRSDLGVVFLGNAAAPRAAAADGSSGTVLPRSSDPNAPSNGASESASIFDRVSPSGGPQDVASAQAAWGAAELQQRENEVLAAVNCARKAQGAPALVLDPALGKTAGDAWLKLVQDRSWSLMDLTGSYKLRSVMALDFGAPDQATQADQMKQQTQGALRCGVGGLDAASLTVAGDGTRIGISVFPPQASWDGASAVVLVQ